MKHFTFAVCMSACAMLLVTGCSQTQELKAAIDRKASAEEISTLGLKVTKNKTTKNEIIQAIGAPGMVFRNDRDCETWVYPRVAVIQASLGASANANFAALFPWEANVKNKGGGLAGVYVNTDLGANRSAYKTAALMIKFNAKGCISSYEFTATSF